MVSTSALEIARLKREVESLKADLNIWKSSSGGHADKLNKTETLLYQIGHMCGGVKGLSVETVPELVRNALNNDKRKKALSDLKKVTETQCADGNWNYDAYMHGMANGLILAQAIMNDETPQYKEAPVTWLADRAPLTLVESQSQAK